MRTYGCRGRRRRRRRSVPALLRPGRVRRARRDGRRCSEAPVASAAAVRVSGGETLLPSCCAGEAASPAARRASGWSSLLGARGDSEGIALPLRVGLQTLRGRPAVQNPNPHNDTKHPVLPRRLRILSATSSSRMNGCRDGSAPSQSRRRRHRIGARRGIHAKMKAGHPALGRSTSRVGRSMQSKNDRYVATCTLCLVHRNPRYRPTSSNNQPRRCVDRTAHRMALARCSF